MNRPALPTTATTVDPETDRRFMAAAINLGRHHAGQTWPNPSVGALVVRMDGDVPVVVGRGTTGPGGRPHAETIALAEAGDAARGATVYVTLEPCAHHGRTPPCCEALSKAGVARVVTALEDPDPRVAGKGHTHLIRHGVQVTSGVLAREARRLHAGHLCRIRRGRPHVLLKLAVSADGFIGREGDGQVPISGPVAKSYAHGLRSEADAIMVGAGTVIADDPELTCRLPGLAHRSPLRIVLDASARTPLTAKLVRTNATVPTWIFVGPDAPDERIAALRATGVRVLVAERGVNTRLDPYDIMYQLGRAGVTSVMSEGGATVAESLVRADLVDEVHLVLAPVSVGDGGVPALGSLPVEAITDPARFQFHRRRQLGADLLLHLFRREHD